MLVVIAATPSMHPFHILISLLLPITFHAFYFRLLYPILGFWKFLHPSVPLLLLLVTQFHSYGAFQKGMILYLVALANFHYSLLSHLPRTKARAQTVRRANRDLERLIAEGWIDRKATVTEPSH